VNLPVYPCVGQHPNEAYLFYPKEFWETSSEGLDENQLDLIGNYDWAVYRLGSSDVNTVYETWVNGTVKNAGKFPLLVPVSSRNSSFVYRNSNWFGFFTGYICI
jgi:hypothetical protein